MSPEIRIITVRTHQNHENRGHQNNYVDIADTNIINATNSHNNYYDNVSEQRKLYDLIHIFSKLNYITN